MTTENTNQYIGKKILSIDFGVGTISGIEKLQAKGDNFYVIEYGKDNVKNYSSMEENKKIRFLAKEEDFSKDIKRLKTKNITKDFKSKEDRQSYFNGLFKNCNLTQVIDKVIEINSIDDLAVREKSKLDKLLKTLELEAAIIYDLSSSKSKTFISDFLK